MTREEELLLKIDALEKRLAENSRAELGIEAAGFDIWENNFVTGETYGTNKRCFEGLGYSEEELPLSLNDIYPYIHPDDLKEALKKINAHFDGLTPRYQAEMRLLAKDGSWVWFGNYGKVIERNAEGKITRFLGLSFDIDRRRMMEEEIKALAYKDALTELGNRHGFYELGNAELARSIRYSHPLSVIIFDVDHFKSINDEYGHLIGDEVLKGIGDCVRATVRVSDIKARWGGDEFVLMLPETGILEAEELTVRLMTILKEHAFSHHIQVTISAGVASLNPDDDMTSLLKRADQALYQAKHKGRNRIEF